MRSMISLAICLFSLLTWPSCHDACKDVLCDKGQCEEGTCICEDGWGGTLCDTRRSGVFTGEWQGSFTCEDEMKETTLSIADDPEDLYKLILNPVGLSLTFDGLTFGLDETTLMASINPQFTSFSIDTQTMIIQLPNTAGVSAQVFGNGALKNTDPASLEILIRVQNVDFGAYFSCSGTVLR